MGARTRIRTRTGVAAAALAGLGAAVLLALAPAGAASAHNSVTGTSPAADSVVTTQPGAVSLTTSDELLDIGAGNLIDVIGPDGAHYASACATVTGADVSVPVELGGAGSYTVEWRVVSADGHPISGEFGFEWAPVEGQTITAGTAEASCAELAAGGSSDAPSIDDGAAEGSASGVPLDALWIGAAAVLVVAAGLVTWLLVRRREPADSDDDSDDDSDADSKVGGDG